MRGHYNIDGLVDYSLESIDETIKVVNPDYRRLCSQIAKLTGRHNKQLTIFAALHIEGSLDPDEIEAYETKKADILSSIEQLATEISEIKVERKGIKRHIAIKELPETEKFQRLAMPRKQLIDTIKMIAYRSETAMATILRPHLSRPDEVRKLLQTLYKTEANLIPDEKNQTLTVKLHHLANTASDNAIEKLCEELNETEIVFPGTNLRLIYKLGTT